MSHEISTTRGGIEIADNADIQLTSLSRKTTPGSQPQNGPTPSNSAPRNDTARSMIYNRKTLKQKKTEIAQLTVLFWCAFLSVYHVGFTIVSLIFVCSCTGFIAGALANFHLTERVGFGKTLLLASVCQIFAATLQAPAPPFPVFVIGYVIYGFGGALQLSQTTGLVVNMKENGDIKMGIFQAFYGLGALVSPFVATQFAQIRHWSFHYFISLGFAVINFVLILIVFKLKTLDDCLRLIGEEAGEKNTSERSPFHQVLHIKAVHYLAFFALFYVGLEISIGGWIVTFMINVRGGGLSSGYISSGFFGGLMLGRVLLIWVNKKLGERLALFCYTVIAIALELVVWFVPSLIGGAVAVSLVGLLLGPMYPIAMNEAGRVLPFWLITSAVGWISGFGQAGGAALPFITGVISSKYGITSLQPLLIAMMGCMLFLWYLVPAKRRD